MREMAESDTKLRTRRALAWVGLASSLVTLLDAISGWLILRIWITPTEFGVATLAVTLFPILDLATDMGIASAVIQKDDHTEETLASVFWLNLAMSVVLAGLLFPAGHLLAAFHGHPILSTMLAAYGGKLIFQNVYTLPVALMKRELRFKELSMIRIVANVGEFIAKLTLAAGGAGVWTFVFAPMVRILATGIGVQLRHPWRPRLVLQLSTARTYVAFGLKTSFSQILFFFYTNVDYQVVGRYFGATALGYYRWAYELVLEPVRIISAVVVEIAFPVFARLRHRPAELVEQFISFTRQNLIVVIPFISWILLAADDILLVFLGPAWVAAAPTARILCAVGLLRAVSFVMPPLLDGSGHPSLTLVYMTVCSIVLPAMYVGFAAWLGPEMGYESVAVAWAAGYPVAFAVLTFLVMRGLGVSAGLYVRRIAGILACAGASLAAGALARLATASARAGVRLAIIVLVSTSVLAILLAWFQGISPRSVARGLRGVSPTEADPTANA